MADFRSEKGSDCWQTDAKSMCTENLPNENGSAIFRANI
jgi:hypothetical protein